jgi:hypothetical protein
MKKTKPIEIVHSKEEQAFDRLADIVLQKLADREANKPETDEELSESVLLQPWMLPRHITDSIRNLLPMTHWQKWADVYEDYGCFKCDRKDVPHQSLGLCMGCYGMLMNRAKAAIVKRVEGKKGRPTVREIKAQITHGQDSAKKILAEIVTNSRRALPAPSKPRSDK